MILSRTEIKYQYLAKITIGVILRRLLPIADPYSIHMQSHANHNTKATLKKNVEIKQF